jgi:hypothetical protein
MKTRSRSLTPGQVIARDERRAKFAALSKKVAAMSAVERAQLAASMPGIVTVEGRALSPFNSCLIIMQSGGRATIVGGFRQWIRAGRCVRKGEHGFSIWIPCAGKTATEAGEAAADDSGEAPERRFIVGCVFDIMQTDLLGSESEQPAVAVEMECAA